jgi:hypothetical protein
MIDMSDEGREGTALPPGTPFVKDTERARGTLRPMPEPPPVSQEDLRTLLVHNSVRLAMLKIAYNRARSIVGARELVAEAAVLLLSGVSPWTPDPNRPVMDQIAAFIVHTSLIIRRCHSNKVTSAAARREREFPDELADRVGDGRPNVEQRAIEIEEEQQLESRASVWIDALCARMAEDGDALAVISQHRLGRDDAQDQADALGWALARVMLARRRIQYRAPIVKAEQLEAERQAEEQRIARAGEAAEKKKVQP